MQGIESVKMTPQKQNISGLRSNEVKGDCMAACIASILDVPLSRVPNFMMYDKPLVVLQDFVEKCGYRYNGSVKNPPNEWLQSFKGVDGYAMVGGTSPRPYVNRHAVVYKNGKPFFDPHPDGTFILGNAGRVFLITK